MRTKVWHFHLPSPLDPRPPPAGIIEKLVDPTGGKGQHGLHDSVGGGSSIGPLIENVAASKYLT